MSDADISPDLPKVTPESLREAVKGRARGEELVVVLHPDVRLDDTEFEATNPGITVRRTTMIRQPHQVFVFDRGELVRHGMAVETDEGLWLRQLPGEPAT